MTTWSCATGPSGAGAGSARSTPRSSQDKRPVVIIHDETDEIDLPDKADEAAFSDVYIVKGDPTSEVVLRRAKVPKAHSVIVLTDDREGKHADGKSILTCIAIRNICKGDKQPNIARPSAGTPATATTSRSPAPTRSSRRRNSASGSWPDRRCSTG